MSAATLLLSLLVASGQPAPPGGTPAPLGPVQHWPAVQPAGRELPKSPGCTTVCVSVATAAARAVGPMPSAPVLAPMPITRAPIDWSCVMAARRDGTPANPAA